MSGPEAQKPDDPLLNEFLAGAGAVRVAYRDAAQQQAPAHLDAAILQAAQSAASPALRVSRRRWQLPMATAAVMVLSFSVFFQVQRDPTAQKERVAPPDLAATQNAAKTEVLAEAAPTPEAAGAVQKQAPPAVAKLKAPAEKRRVAPLTAPPPAQPAPTTAMAMAEAPSPAPEAAAMAADTVAQPAVAGAVMRDSTSRPEQFAAPIAKARSAPPTSILMSPKDVGKFAASTSIERWAQSCVAESLELNELPQWRGLPLASWIRQGGDAVEQTALWFAPTASYDAIVASLGTLAAKATLTTATCVGPVTRELLQVSGGWALVCECRLYSE